MPWWAASLAVFLARIAKSLVARVLAALGLGVTSLVGVSSSTDAIVSSLKGAVSGVPSNALAFFTMLGFDTYLSLVVSAFVTVILWKVAAGFFKHFAFLPDSSGGN